MSNHMLANNSLTVKASRKKQIRANRSGDDSVKRGVRTFTFSIHLDILIKHWLLQRKLPKYMYAKCLNFPCFTKNLAACMMHFACFICASNYSTYQNFPIITGRVCLRSTKRQKQLLYKNW